MHMHFPSFHVASYLVTPSPTAHRAAATRSAMDLGWAARDQAAQRAAREAEAVHGRHAYGRRGELAMSPMAVAGGRFTDRMMLSGEHGQQADPGDKRADL